MYCLFEKTENKQKEAGVGPFFIKTVTYKRLYHNSQRHTKRLQILNIDSLLARFSPFKLQTIDDLWPVSSSQQQRQRRPILFCCWYKSDWFLMASKSLLRKLAFGKRWRGNSVWLNVGIKMVQFLPRNFLKISDLEWLNSFDELWPIL